MRNTKIRNILLFSTIAILVGIDILGFPFFNYPQYKEVQAQSGLKSPETTGRWLNRYSYDIENPDGTHTTTFYAGPQVFWDGNNWQELKFVENPGFCSSPNCRFFIQNAHTALEIYDYYVKYYDPDYQEVALYDERFEVQRWIGKRWQDIGAQSGIPTFTYTANEDYIEITKSFTSWAGGFNISYILRPASPLKHNIVFKSVLKETIEFRVIMKLTGITHNRVSYSQGEDNITEEKHVTSPYFFVGEDNNNLKFKEFLWSLGIVDEGTGEWAPTKLKDIVFNAHAQGIKADIIIGNYALGENQQLEIDPLTETLYISTGGNDGRVAGYDTDYETARTTAYSSDSTSWRQGLGQRGTSGNYTVWRDFLKFDTSSIPSEATITAANLGLYGQEDQSTTDFYIRLQKWTGDTPIDDGDYNQFDGTNYDDGLFSTSLGFTIFGYNTITISNFDLITKAGYTKICLRSSRDINANPPDWGLYEYVNFYNYESGSGHIPKLVVTYNTPPALTSVSDSPDPQQGGSDVSFTSVASDPDSGDTIKLYVCKDSTCTNCAPGNTTNCWAVTTTGIATNPSASYTCFSCAAATNDYYAKICDQNDACSSITSVQTFTCKKENGCAETTAANCFSGFAADSYCCDSACTGTCEICDSTGSEGTCTLRSADDNTECSTCNRCDGTNTTCQAQTGETGYLCTDDCYDCVSGVCTAMTEDDDGSCNADCNSCVSGTCALRTADDTVECDSGYRCDGTNTDCQLIVSGAPILPPFSFTGHGNISENLGGEVRRIFESNQLAKVVFPSHSIKGTVVVIIDPRDIEEVTKNNLLPKNLRIIGDLVADFKVLFGGKRLEKFEKEIPITFTYSDEQIREVEVDEKTLRIYFWDKTTSSWKFLKSEVKIVTNAVTAYTSHFTLFAVMGEIIEEKPITEMETKELLNKMIEVLTELVQLYNQLIQLLKS